MQGRSTRTVAVVGGGLAGLAAAISAAEAGASVTLFDARDELGGRARTHQDGGFSFNQGPHALYRGGAAMAALRRWGIRVPGRAPSLLGADLAVGGELQRAGRPGALGLDAFRLARAGWGRHAVDQAEGRSMADWIAAELPEGRPRLAAAAFTRLTSYNADLDHSDAGAHLRQIRRAGRGVIYVDGGWSTLVTALGERAERLGVRIVRHHKVAAVRRDGATWVVNTDGMDHPAHAVVLAAGGAEHADALLGGASPTLARWAATARPVVAGCLDVALSTLPNPRHTTIVGLDEPTYCVVHSLAARLAPEGAALVHVLRYGGGDDPAALRSSLEAQLDRAQPGWRSVVVEARFGRRLVVAHDVARVEAAERPDVAPGDLDGCFVAGDWITTDGLLADAAVGSGCRAGTAAAGAAHATSSPPATASATMAS